MTMRTGVVIAGCLMFLLGGWAAYAATPNPSKIKSNTMAPSGHPKKHYGAPIQQPILKQTPKRKAKPAPQLKSTLLPAQTPSSAPRAP